MHIGDRRDRARLRERPDDQERDAATPNYDKFYQNIFPGGAVNAGGHLGRNLSAYNNETDRQNLFNQTDLTYKLDAGWSSHTLLAGAEVGRQNGFRFVRTGFFNNVATSTTRSRSTAAIPMTYVPVIFRNIPTAPNNTYTLNLGGAYLQDQIEITRYLQLIGGVRFDRFDLDSARSKHRHDAPAAIDDLVSPRVGVDRQAGRERLDLRQLQRLVPSQRGRSVQHPGARNGDRRSRRNS